MSSPSPRKDVIESMLRNCPLNVVDSDGNTLLHNGLANSKVLCFTKVWLQTVWAKFVWPFAQVKGKWLIPLLDGVNILAKYVLLCDFSDLLETKQGKPHFIMQLSEESSG